MLMKVTYWIERQDALLQKHNNARPNQKEFWFDNIVDELNSLQTHIDKCNRKEASMDVNKKQNVWVWHGFHHGLLHMMEMSVNQRRKEVIIAKPSREVYTRLKLLRAVKGDLPDRLVDDQAIYGALTTIERKAILALHEKECGCKMGRYGDIMNAVMLFPSWRRGNWQKRYLVPGLPRWYRLCDWWRRKRKVNWPDWSEKWPWNS